MSMYKLVCSDIDGTLLNSQKNVSEATIKAVRELVKTIPFVLISARMPKAMTHIQQALKIEHSPMVCYNGGLILHGNKVLGSTVIASNIAHKVAETILDKDLHFGIYHQDEWYVSKDDYWAKREVHNTKVTPVVKQPQEVFTKWANEEKEAHKLMCMGEEEKVEAVYQSLSERFSDELHLYRSKPTYIEIAPKSISKLTGILTIAQQVYDVKPNEIVAYGDNYNDVELLAGTGLGVAVANAVAPVKAAADQETHSGKEDGVAKHLTNLFKL